MPITKNNKSKLLWKRFVSEYSIVLVAVAMVLIATLLEGETFMTGKNFINILRNNSVQGIIAFGMSFVIISGNIDLSVGSQLVVVGIVCLSVLNATGSILLAILAAIAISCVLSAITGLIVTKGRVPSFIVTLGMQYVLRSVSIFAMDARGITGEVKAFQEISNYSLGGWLPMPIIYFALMFVIYFYLSKYTVLGRRIYAVGSNEKATRLSGINTDTIKIISFVLLGIAVAVAAVTEASRMNSINSTSSGTSYELNAIAMAVVGGISMQGGKGNMVGTLFGIFILGIINNILTLVGMNVYLVNAVKGAIIIFAVLLQRKERD
ncbi:MAG TPA: ABC transporter permease [Feifaniaceae bacterium]|nr:ABC transporter permease [Feifaniaceae bacterium]